MCCVCRVSKDKKELLRIVKNKDGEIFIDPTGKANGRGAYICKEGNCASEAEKKKALERSFKSSVDKELFSSLMEMKTAD
ncbi:MAG: YlxR family protein [Clostridia bacterium]|nr:YlxR family protein [Clostridia bacterium]